MEPKSTKETNEQNKTKDMDIKDKLEMTRGEVGLWGKEGKEAIQGMNRRLMGTDIEGYGLTVGVGGTGQGRAMGKKERPL